jgi:hypothetical protein
MSQVDKLQDAEEQVAQMREEAAQAERETRAEDLRRPPLADTAAHAYTTVTAPLERVRTMANMRVGVLPDLHELAVSIKETGLLHPRAAAGAAAGARRVGAREGWRRGGCGANRRRR